MQMKTYVIISSLLVFVGGTSREDLLPIERESVARSAVPAVSVGETALPEVMTGQFEGHGEYLEVRSAAASAGAVDKHRATAVAGDQAVLAWRVSEGAYRGVPLDGLAVVAVVVGKGPIGIADEASTRTTFLVDAQADLSQRAALVAMAKAFAGDTIQHVVEIRPVKIDMNVCRGCAAGFASLKADMITVRTRRVLDSDKQDDIRERGHSALAKVFFQYPAVALEHRYSGRDFEGNPIQLSDASACMTAVGGF
jgi:hypothetical protein